MSNRVRFAWLTPDAVLLAGAVLALAALPLSYWERLPHICLNRYLFGLCPGCGTTRALAALFHGQLAAALRHNPNCLVAGPLLLALLGATLRPRVDAGRRPAI